MRPEHALRARVTMDEVIQAVGTAKGEKWADFESRYGDTGAALAMWVARRCTGLTLHQIGEAAGGRDYAAVGMATLRLERRLKHAKSLRRELARVSQLLDVLMP